MITVLNRLSKQNHENIRSRKGDENRQLISRLSKFVNVLAFCNRNIDDHEIQEVAELVYTAICQTYAAE